MVHHPCKQEEVEQDGLRVKRFHPRKEVVDLVEIYKAKVLEVRDFSVGLPTLLHLLE